MGEPTSTFTGDTCLYEGPDSFALSDQPTFTVRNDSQVEAFLNVVQIPDDMTLDQLVADFPVIESAVPAKPAEVIRFRRLEPGEEAPMAVRFRSADRVGTACVPFDGGPSVPGAVITVTD